MRRGGGGGGGGGGKRGEIGEEEGQIVEGRGAKDNLSLNQEVIALPESFPR